MQGTTCINKRLLNIMVTNSYKVTDLRYNVIGCTNMGVSWMCILVHIISGVSRLRCLSKLNTITTTLRSLQMGTIISPKKS